MSKGWVFLVGRIIGIGFIVISLGLLAFALFERVWGSDPDRVERLSQQVPTLILSLTFWIFMFFFLPGIRLRRTYRREPAFQSDIAVSITNAGISIRQLTGSSQLDWNTFKFWKEGKGLIMLMYHSPIYAIVKIEDLHESEREELRGILAAALPQKK